MTSTSKAPPENSEIIMVAQRSSIPGVSQDEKAIDPNINTGGTGMNILIDDENESHPPASAMESGP